MHGPGDAVEPGVQRSDHCRRLRRLRERGEVAQVGREQYRADGLPGAAAQRPGLHPGGTRSEEHTSELQSLMRISYAVFCLKKKNPNKRYNEHTYKRITQLHS